MLSQKDAVYQATMAVLQQNGVGFEDGQDVREAISENPKLRGQIRDLVFEGLKNGQVAFGNGDNKPDDRSMRTYATGLISNWFRKDKRLNGGQRYQPGSSRDQGGQVSGSEDRIRKLQAAIESTDDDDLKKRLQEAIDDVKEQQSLEARLADDVKAGRYKGEDDLEEEEEGDDGEEEQEAEGDEGQDNPPSMGSGHRGAVTDPEHDMRLKRNETPELARARQEAGHRGGTSVREERGSDFFSKIGQKGGLSRGGRRSQEGESGNKDGNIFLKMLRKQSA